MNDKKYILDENTEKYQYELDVEFLENHKTDINIEGPVVYNAIKNSKRIYPATIIKELDLFRNNFKSIAIEEGINLPLVLIEDLDKEETIM